MKQKLLGILLFGAMLLWSMPAFAAADIGVTINGETMKFDSSPQVINGRTLVPMRAIFEEFGMVVDWNGDDKSIFARNGVNSIRMQIGNKTTSKNGMQVATDAAPMILDGRTMVPLRYIATALDMDVNWNGDTRTVEIVTADDSYKEYHAWYEVDRNDILFVMTNVPVPDKYVTRLTEYFSDHQETDVEQGREKKYARYRFGGFTAYRGTVSASHATFDIFFNKTEQYMNDHEKIDGVPDVSLKIDNSLRVVTEGTAVPITTMTIDDVSNTMAFTTSQPLKTTGVYFLDLKAGNWIIGTGLGNHDGKLWGNIRFEKKKLYENPVYLYHFSGKVTPEGNATICVTPEDKPYYYGK